MPFLGKDWRSSGEQWIRTEHGWERTRVLECILDNLNIGLNEEKIRRKRFRKKSSPNKRLDSVNDDELDEIDSDERMSSIDEENDEGWNYVYDELSLLSEDDDFDDDDDDLNPSQLQRMQIDDDDSSSSSRKSVTPSSCFLRSRSASQSIRRQPHIIYWEVDTVNRENNAPRATISEVLNALDMPGAVKDIKRFNYVCRIAVLNGLFEVIKSQENLNVMRKLLHDFKKKIQDSIYFYFYYIGSQKLCDRHLATITKWQEILENPSHHRKLKRLNSANKRPSLSSDDQNADKENQTNSVTFESIPIDCKLEIMRRLNCGLDLVNVSKCNRNLNDLISSELKIWKNLCQFHFQQASINSFVTRLQKKDASSSGDIAAREHLENDHDWKLIYFRLKRRFGHREVYTDMVHKCYHCKSLFWKEIGHPCVIKESLAYPDLLEIRSEPITPKKLIDLLLR